MYVWSTCVNRLVGIVIDESCQPECIHEGAMSSIASCSYCSRRFNFASSSEKMSPIWQACCSRGAEPKGRIMCRSARVVAQDCRSN